MSAVNNRIIIFDTTMRDGELMPGVRMNLQNKLSIAEVLEKIGVDIIEIGHPGHSKKDFEEIYTISKFIKNSTICGLASPNLNEISMVAEAIKPAVRGRINTYTSVNIKDPSKLIHKQVLETITNTVSLARNFCDDVEWNAFDATRSEPDFLCNSIEVAIESGATTITIPDSLGLASTEKFLQLIEMIFNSVPNIDKAIVSVHCHDDLGMAVNNSIIGLNCGVRQIECAINGLGARKGNADLEKVIREVLKQSNSYQIGIDTSLISSASDLVTKITGIQNK